MPAESLVVAPFVLKHEHPHAHPDACTFDAASDFTVEMSYEEKAADANATPKVTALSVTVAADGHSVSAVLPASPRPLKISVKVTPTGANAKRYWEVAGDIQYVGNAKWKALPTTPVQFAAPPSLLQPATSTTAFLNVWLSRVKDVTSVVVAKLQVLPQNRLNMTPPTTWKVPAASSHFIGSTPVSGGAIQVDGPATVDPNTTDLVFHIQGFKTPQLIAMCWPNTFTFPMAPPDPAASDPKPTYLQAAPAPFLIFFHAQHGQNMPYGYYTNGAWPYGWDFLYFGLYHYLIYGGDAIQQQGSLGLPIQARRAGKTCIVVVPQNKYGSQGPADEIVEFNDPELVQETLEELQTYMYFRTGKKFARPNIGRTAAGSMSNGNVLLTAFLNSHPSKPFLQNTVREIYVFDPNGDDDTLNAAPVSAALSWAKSGPSDKMIRYFAQKLHPIHKQLLGGAPPSGNFVQDGTNPNFTGGVLNWHAWVAIGATVVKNEEWQTPHQLLPGMLLTHAFRKSGF